MSKRRKKRDRERDTRWESFEAAAVSSLARSKRESLSRSGQHSQTSSEVHFKASEMPKIVLAPCRIRDSTKPLHPVGWNCRHRQQLKGRPRSLRVSECTLYERKG